MVEFVKTSLINDDDPLLILGEIPAEYVLDQVYVAPDDPRLFDRVNDKASPEQTELFPDTVNTGLGFTVKVATTEVSQGPVALVTMQRKLMTAAFEFNPETVRDAVFAPE